MTIINLTQHQATEDQVAVGVVNVIGANLTELKTLLTFPAVYTTEMLKTAAEAIAKLAWIEWNASCQAAADADTRPLSSTDDAYMDYWYHSPKEVMIGGMPSFMRHLEDALIAKGFRVGYACTARVSVDKPDGKGGVEKTAVFKHVGMYWAN